MGRRRRELLRLLRADYLDLQPPSCPATTRSVHGTATNVRRVRATATQQSRLLRPTRAGATATDNSPACATAADSSSIHRTATIIQRVRAAATRSWRPTRQRTASTAAANGSASAASANAAISLHRTATHVRRVSATTAPLRPRSARWERHHRWLCGRYTYLQKRAERQGRSAGHISLNPVEEDGPVTPPLSPGDIHLFPDPSFFLPLIANNLHSAHNHGRRLPDLNE